MKNPRVQNQVKGNRKSSKGKKKKTQSKGRKTEFDPPLRWNIVPKDPPKFAFNEDHGLKADALLEMPDMEPESFFNLLFTEELLELMVEETNKYAKYEMGRVRSTRKKHSRMNEWTDVDVEEMRKFVGIFLLMGVHNMPSMKDYWSYDPLYRTYVFRTVMSRNRFQNILRYWHFSNNEIDQEGRLKKILPLINYFNEKMRSIYIPGTTLLLTGGPNSIFSFRRIL